MFDKLQFRLVNCMRAAIVLHKKLFQMETELMK